MSVGKLTGPKKAAILLLALGEDAAAAVSYTHLTLPTIYSV